MILDHQSLTTVDALIGRLDRLLARRFGAVVQYQPLGPDDEALRDRLLAEVPVVMDGQLLFPVIRHYQVVGCAKVILASSVSAGPSGQSGQLQDLVELYLEAAVALTDQVERLTKLETVLDLGTTDPAKSNNVIPLRRPAQPLAYARRPRLGFALPCLLEGPNPVALRHLALELHDLSGRFAFVGIDDLTVSTSHDLEVLGPVTIFIPDVERLELKLQLALADYLARRPGVDQAQLIAASERSYSELRTCGLVTVDLLHRISVCYLKMDRDLREFKQDGVIQFFFDSLTRDNLSDRIL